MELKGFDKEGGALAGLKGCPWSAGVKHNTPAGRLSGKWYETTRNMRLIKRSTSFHFSMPTAKHTWAQNNNKIYIFLSAKPSDCKYDFKNKNNT